MTDSFQVVPAGESTSESWTYPPFSGHYDGEYIWGRGSEDDKSNLIAMLTAIDCLLACDFTPDRTVIVSVGFDEEGGAEQSYGARCLAEKLLDRYGKDGVEMIVCSLESIGLWCWQVAVWRRHCRHWESFRDRLCSTCNSRERIYWRGCDSQRSWGPLLHTTRSHGQSVFATSSA